MLSVIDGVEMFPLLMRNRPETSAFLAQAALPTLQQSFWPGLTVYTTEKDINLGSLPSDVYHRSTLKPAKNVCGLDKEEVKKSYHGAVLS